MRYNALDREVYYSIIGAWVKKKQTRFIRKYEYKSQHISWQDIVRTFNVYYKHTYVYKRIYTYLYDINVGFINVCNVCVKYNYVYTC